METAELYDLVNDAVRAGLAEYAGGQRITIARRMEDGRVLFTDGLGKQFKEVHATVFFRKVTAVREQLRVLEQKINNSEGLSATEKAEFQSHLTRSYGTLTTFNFLFQEDDDKFKGSGSD